MANGSDTEAGSVGRGLLTFVAAIGLIAVVAFSITSYDPDTDVPRVQVEAGDRVSASDSSGTALGAAPVGGVATGGGGTATDRGGSLALPVLGGLAALALLAAAGTVRRPRPA